VRFIPLPLIAPPFIRGIKQHTRTEDPLLKAAFIQCILSDKEFSESCFTYRRSSRKVQVLDTCSFVHVTQIHPAQEYRYKLLAASVPTFIFSFAATLQN
jgi:hypothetical protein